MKFIKVLQDYIAKELEKNEIPKSPVRLYEPIRYILTLGGKRMRPVLALLGHHLFDDRYERSISAAISLELFHNFTLIHDDIMDDAPLRRNKESIHRKWNNNIAILSGDAMLIMAYKKLQQLPNNVDKILNQFNKTALEICQGQQKDIMFEEKQEVSIAEYKEMIRLKTAVLLGCSLKIGAWNGGASDEDAERLYKFGEHLGIAFQLRDDHLDVYANGNGFGKQVGGDIRSNKKTFLLVSALEKAQSERKDELINTMELEDDSKKLNRIKSLYDELDIASVSKSEMQHHYDIAYKALESIKSVSEERKTHLYNLGHYLMHREV